MARKRTNQAYVAANFSQLPSKLKKQVMSEQPGAMAVAEDWLREQAVQRTCTGWSAYRYRQQQRWCGNVRARVFSTSDGRDGDWMYIVTSSIIGKWTARAIHQRGSPYKTREAARRAADRVLKKYGYR